MVMARKSLDDARELRRSGALIRVLREISREHRGRLAVTYALVICTELAMLLQPQLIGSAIDGALSRHLSPIITLIVFWILLTVSETAGAILDTRTFGRMYFKWVSAFVVRRRKSGAEVSQVVARSALSRELIDFFEMEVIGAVTTFIGLFGSALLLAQIDVRLGLACGVALVIVSISSFFMSNLAIRFHRKLNDRLELEVDTIADGDEVGVSRHFEEIAQWRIRLSDLSAWNFAGSRLIALALIVAVLYVGASADNISPGTLFAACSYALSFAALSTSLPMLLDQMTRLWDIAIRMEN
ncbi:ABC transporter six-transmembrane domain-containing protein [Streptomyces rubiginosohelvolus]|uniref:ABC transporter six-transmembrane domain-containing protein n=1 Tax=Streptomyces rubiginosohelvolus TaxID=67362 RepID=UPI0036A5ABD6